MTFVITKEAIMSISQQVWQRHIDAWKNAGTSQAKYCRSHNLCQTQFSYWKRKLVLSSVATSSVTSKFALAQVETVTEQVTSLLSITLPNGTLIDGIDQSNAHVAVTLIERMV